ncbi:MAG: hypothetical protein Q8N23_25485 [Archangium sp.]|nr:hypothetical protein [Archangium sp.]MDP3156052.1 hypothetical protein [Archangium sp.]MDP3572810.1 hypothetical protein [Archangium sp.]
MKHALLILLVALPAFAQKEEIFGTGKPPNFREEKMDSKFVKSKFSKMLVTGTEDPGCVQLLGGLFVALAEIAPVIHKRDENFVLPPELQEAVQSQLSTPGFPAVAYLVAMVRKIMIEKRLPDEWLATAVALNKKVKLIDLAKLKMINEQIKPADSAYFTIPLLRERYAEEALNANSAVTTDVVAAFHDTYVDRDIAWGGATLLDIGINQPKGKGKKKRYRDAAAEELVAVLQWMPQDPRMNQVNLLAQAPVKVDPVIIYVRLASKQYADLEKFHRGQRVMVKGQFFEMNKSATELEIREGLLFSDRDWSTGVLLGRPQDVATCPVALNELTGTAAQQPGGFAH